MFDEPSTTQQDPMPRVGEVIMSSGLRVEQISQHAWRVSEGSNSALAPLLGFIKQRGERFEVTQLGDTFEWSAHHTLAAASIT